MVLQKRKQMGVRRFLTKIIMAGRKIKHKMFSESDQESDENQLIIIRSIKIFGEGNRGNLNNSFSHIYEW